MKKFLDGLERLLSVVCTGLFLVIAILIAVQVFTRYVMDHTLAWSEQAARGAFIWLIMLYSGVLGRKGGNLGFDIMVKRLPPVGRHICQFITEIAILVFAVYWFYQGILLCQSFVGFTLWGLQLPYNVLYVAEPVGAFLIALFDLELLVNHVKQVKEGGLHA